MSKPSAKKKEMSTLDFFKYFKSIVGWHIYGYMIVNLLVGLLDGLGLTLFIPVIKLASDKTNENFDKLQVLVDAFNYVGIEFNLINSIILIVLIFIIKAIFVYSKLIYFNKIRLMGIRKVRLKLANGLYALSYEGFTKMDAGKLQNSMTQEASRIITAMIGFFTSIQNVIMLLTYVGIAIFLDWQFAILVGIGGIITNFFYKYINSFVRKKSRELTDVGVDFFSYLTQSIHNFKYLKATNSIENYIKKLKYNIIKGEQITFKMNAITSLAEALREPVIMMIICGVLMVQISVLERDITPILASLLMFYRSLGYLVAMQSSYMGFVGSSAGVEAIENLFTDLDKYKEEDFGSSIEKINEIKIDSVNLKFGNKTILSNINFTIPKNSSIAFVGESGAGKTTLANIICGLQKPDSGQIVTDNVNIYESQLKNYRNRIGYITQEPVIFDDTLFNNVTFWDKKTPETLEKFWKTMHLVSLKNFAEELELKENTPLGNNGILVSGGQKQRISIARELYKNVELLIMDEATSALDSETEKFIKENIDLLNGKVTMIIIAHRLSTIKNVDMIYLMDKGEIIGKGNFNELTQSSEKFKKMVNLQEI